ncbi:hypothetical protein RhiirA5_430577 [Rhizophagus irregularis]|uniref:Uncharacterized protein n=1 Tax=Rhizophagus irregularis TaxID=588596 RepID=A0A2I1EMR2_9GLOM|nr:hypothetical protein RhiirA5_430577 [Rhizophagus irregularis]PKY23409.1 hypothetical protein RhiirB3_437606 [Rhizophagus irregularis]
MTYYISKSTVFSIIVYLSFKDIGGFSNIIGTIDGWPELDYLLGDLAYLLSNFLIKPFTNTQNNLQIQFNITHFLHHCIVMENAFGRLKNRFNCLKELNIGKISTAVCLTECCIILHNFLESNNDNCNDNNNSNNSDDSDYDNDYNYILKRAGEMKKILLYYKTKN